MSILILKLDPSDDQQSLGVSAYSTAKQYYDNLCSSDMREFTKGTEYEQTHEDALAGNYGCALTTIPGLEGPYVAFSSLNEDEHIAIFEGVLFPKGIVVRFKGEEDGLRNFQVLRVNRKNQVGEGMGYFPRYHDSEAKILERLYDDLLQRGCGRDIRGAVHLYTYLYPCGSCEYVVNQFQDSKEGFPNIDVIIYYEVSTSRNRGKGRVSSP